MPNREGGAHSCDHRKGKGYEPAQLHRNLYHGVGPFIKKNGMAKKPKEEATYTDIFAKTICELAQTHEKLCNYYSYDGRLWLKKALQSVFQTAF